jgi:hypothetical protein
MSTPALLDFTALSKLATQSDANASACTCTKTPLDGWQSMPLSLSETQLREIGTLMVPSEEEPTYSEYHPHNTRYWSADAPIAPRHFPYNRCSVWACIECGRCYLRYTEGGGYFVDQRIRALRAALLVDA